MFIREIQVGVKNQDNRESILYELLTGNKQSESKGRTGNMKYEVKIKIVR